MTAAPASLVRLPTQFDGYGRAVAPATPTCCCCCCCCIVTLVASSTATTVHVRRVARRTGSTSGELTTRAVIALPAAALLGVVFPPVIPVIHGIWLYKLYLAAGLGKDAATTASVVIALGTVVLLFLEVWFVVNLLVP